MAKKVGDSKSKSGVNKSQAIRDALAKDPNASPKLLSADLTARGIKVSPMYVSIIKSSAKAKAKRRKKPGAVSRTGDAIVPGELLEAKKLVDRVGSIEKVQSLLGTLKKLL